ncbi:uncharacterized protein LODBEIA_P56200 [Lodderomyces beijingensis]|uniref:Chromosome transmission fidelity protein 8 n=1 Tax=Lodderomyces beijingensis TaxID=1775926 RepID=A0ABP0ZTD8_9ASCO
MPVATIDCSKITTATSPSTLPLGSDSEMPNLVTMPRGLALLEIQGVLHLPSEPGTSPDFITVERIYDAVKFGKLIFDAKDESKVTLLIGKSQRLIGSVKKLDVPLGVLRIPVKSGDDEEVAGEDIQMVDVIHSKMIFNQRPLLIM